MSMRRVKRGKEELFGKRFEGVHWESSRLCGRCDGESDDRKKSFFCKVEIVHIQDTSRRGRTIRTARLSTLISYSF